MLQTSAAVAGIMMMKGISPAVHNKTNVGPDRRSSQRHPSLPSSDRRLLLMNFNPATFSSLLPHGRVERRSLCGLRMQLTSLAAGLRCDSKIKLKEVIWVICFAAKNQWEARRQRVGKWDLISENCEAKKRGVGLSQLAAALQLLAFLSPRTRRHPQPETGEQLLNKGLEQRQTRRSLLLLRDVVRRMAGMDSREPL